MCMLEQKLLEQKCFPPATHLLSKYMSGFMPLSAVVEFLWLPYPELHCNNHSSL